MLTEGQKPFAGVMKQYFGLLPGQSVMQFGTELKALSYNEKLEFHKMLTEQGINVALPSGSKPE